jgi:hypothetical protein
MNREIKVPTQVSSSWMAQQYGVRRKREIKMEDSTQESSSCML